MSAETTDALVLKTVDFSESSLILSLFTRNFGKVRAIAKGARRLKNPFETSLDLLSEVRMTFLKKNKDALDLLTEAKLIRRFRPNSENLAGLYAGYYLIELLDLMTDESEPLPELFDLAENQILQFQQGKNISENIVLFELGLLDILGHLPSWRFCVECGQEVCLEEKKIKKQRLGLALIDGGVVCSECREKKGFAQLVSVSPESLLLLEFFAQTAAEFWNQSELPETVLTEFQKNSSVAGEIRGILNHYFCHLLGRRPKMHDYFGLMRK